MPELSGPSAALGQVTPGDGDDVGSEEAVEGAAPAAAPAAAAAANPPPPPDPEEPKDGILPLILVSVSVSPPAAAATLCSPAIEATESELIFPSDTLARLSTSILVPALLRARLPNAPPKPNRGRLVRRLACRSP